METKAVSEKAAVADDVTNSLPSGKDLHSDSEVSQTSVGAIQESQIVRKLDLRLLPWLWVLFALSCLDRANIGNAFISGLGIDLRLTGVQFNVILAAFSITYVLVPVPANWVLRRVGGGKWLSGLSIAWGVVMIGTGAVKSYGALIVVRLLLGLFEGALLPGVVLYLTMVYRREEMAVRLSWFYCAFPFAGAIGGFLATGLEEITYGGYNGWPWIFFIEGIMTVVFSLIAFFFLPDSIETCRFLSVAEKNAAVLRLHDEDSAVQNGDASDDKLNWHTIKLALWNPMTVLLCLVSFCAIESLSSFVSFLPSMIQQMGYSVLISQLFTVPPYAAATLFTLITAYLSDRLRVRGYMLLFILAFALVGYVMLIASEKIAVRYAGTFFVASGTISVGPILFSWLGNNLTPYYVRATGLGFVVAFSSCAGFVAQFTYLQSDAPRYITGQGINLGFVGAAMVLTVVLILYLRWENKQRDQGRRNGRLARGDVDESEHERRMLGHMHPSFRYVV